MSLVVQWYLGCVRACQLEMTSARKPLNPVQGETFKCIWNLKEGLLKILIVVLRKDCVKNFLLYF